MAKLTTATARPRVASFIPVIIFVLSGATNALRRRVV